MDNFRAHLNNAIDRLLKGVASVFGKIKTLFQPQPRFQPVPFSRIFSELKSLCVLFPEDINQCLRNVGHISLLAEKIEHLTCFLPDFSYPFFATIPYGSNVVIAPLSAFKASEANSILIDLTEGAIGGNPGEQTVHISLRGVSNIEFVPEPREASEVFSQFSQLIGVQGEAKMPQPNIRPDCFDKARQMLLQNRFPNIIIHAGGRKSKREIDEIVGFMKRFYSANVYLLDNASKTGLDFTNLECPVLEDLLVMYCFVSAADMLITDSTPIWEFHRNWFDNCLHWRDWKERKGRPQDMESFLKSHFKINPRG